MRNLAALLLVFIPLFSETKAQDTLARKKVVNDLVLTAALDPLNQIYYINNQRQLVKLAPSQDKQFLYTDLFVDARTVIQSHNPFKILLYKKDVGDLAVLDNRLTLTGKINLFDLGYFDVSCISSANDNQSIWLFDQARQQLFRLDQQYKESFASPVMPQLLGTDIHPVYVIETEGKVYLLDPKKGLFIFDNVGNFSKQLPITRANRIWIFGNQIYYYHSGQIWMYDTLLMEERPAYTLEGYSDISLCRDFILGLTPEKELFRIEWNNKPK